MPQVAFVEDAGQRSVTAGIWITVRVKEQVFVTQVVDAVQVTVFVPTGNALPLAGAHARSAPPVTVGLANVRATLLSQMFVVRFAGQVMFTAGIGTTVTVKEQVFVPQALVAVQVTVFVPTGNALPLAGTHATSTPLVTVGLAKATGTLLSQMFVVRFTGQVRFTAGVSATVTLKEQVFVPQVLVAVQVTGFVPRANTLPLAGTQPTSVPPLTAGLA